MAAIPSPANASRATLTKTVPMRHVLPSRHHAQRAYPPRPGVARRAKVGTMDRMRTIALEEHFWTPELSGTTGPGALANFGPRIGDQLRDLGQLRLADMDAHGIDV